MVFDASTILSPTWQTQRHADVGRKRREILLEGSRTGTITI